METSDNASIIHKTITYIPQVLSLVTALCILSSVIYDNFYFMYFNVSILLLPTTMQDHLKSSILFLPYITGFISTLFIIDYFDTKYKNRMDKFIGTCSEENIIDCIVNDKHLPIPKLILYIMYTCIAVSFVIVCISVYCKSYYILLLIVYVFLPVYICVLYWKAYMRPKVDRFKRKYVFSAALLFYALFILIPAMATLSAWAEPEKNNVTIYLKDNNIKKKEAKLLRNFEKSVFIRYSSNKTAILPQSDVLMIESTFRK